MPLRNLAPRPAALAFAFALGFVLAAPLEAGLVFHRVPAPAGADAAALAGDSARLWAATIRGVWRFESGRWTLDGLPDRSLTAVAVAGGTPFAADGAALYRREDGGAWVIESLPAGLLFPSVLVANGGTLYVAGIGAARRENGALTALPAPPGGLARSAGLTGAGELVLGFGDGTAARFSGGAWVAIQGGIPLDEPVQAFTSLGGLLYAGTTRGVYAQSGSGWARNTAFGLHDVRALTAAQGTLRAATSDAGVFRRSGSSWVSESAGLLTLSTRSFGTVGSDLYLGTSGGPVYRSTGSGFVEAKEGLDAAIVTDVHGDFGLVATRGAGALTVNPEAGTSEPFAVAAGCGDLSGAGQYHPIAGPGVSAPFAVGRCGAVEATHPGGTTLGLPAGATPTSAGEETGLVSTLEAGVFGYFGGTFSAFGSGLPPSASVQSLRETGAGTFAAAGPFVFALSGATWSDVSDGLPASGQVLSLGGAVSKAFAGLTAGGVYRRDGAAAWRPDSAGVATASVLSLDVSAQGAAAAAGTGGVRLKRGGGWMPESFGLPVGADVRVVRARTSGPAPGTHGLFAGTAGSGLFFAPADPSVRTIPVVLDVVGGTGARFRTELTIGNRGASATILHATFTPAPGFGAPALAPGTVTFPLAAGTELRAADALELLRGAGLPIPQATSSSPIAGTLSFAADSGAATDAVYSVARTYTKDADGGSYGLFYDAPSDLEAAEDVAFVYGLRSLANVSRSNLALAHLPGRSPDPITLAVQVYAANGAAAGAAIPVTLQPGEWRQLNGILGLAGLPEGSYGYARIARTAGSGPWTAYGVVNDARTSDGSYLPLFRPGGVTAARKLLVPVVLDVFGALSSHFTTELTLVNDGAIATPVDLFYQPAPGAGTAPGLPYVTIPLAAREQRTIPDILQYLRDHGIHVPSASTGAQVGTLEVSFRFLGNLDAPRTVALARTSTPNPNASLGGAFGLFYPAIAFGGGSRSSAIVPALTEDGAVRSNLALVHAYGGSGQPITLSVRLHDAATGAAVGNTITATLSPGDWVQYSRVLELAGASPSTTHAYAVVTRLSGDDTFYAYGVVNDNVTSDGSFLPMIAFDRE